MDWIWIGVLAPISSKCNGKPKLHQSCALSLIWRHMKAYRITDGRTLCGTCVLDPTGYDWDDYKAMHYFYTSKSFSLLSGSCSSPGSSGISLQTSLHLIRIWRHSLKKWKLAWTKIQLRTATFQILHQVNSADANRIEYPATVWRYQRVVSSLRVY